MDDMQAMILSKMNNHTSMKSKKAIREQDTSKRKHKRVISRFKPPLYVSAFTTMKDFPIL